MTLREALEVSQVVRKHVEWEKVGDVAGTYTVSKANFSAGYFKDFLPDDPERRSPFNTSTYWGFDYPGADPLGSIARFAGEDGWEAC